MKTISTKEELKKGLADGVKEFKISDSKMLKALAVSFWIQNNKIKGTALLAALGGATFATAGLAPAAIGTVGAVGAIIGYGLTIGTVTITATEILAIGVIVLGIIAVIKGQQIKEINLKEGYAKFK